MLRPLQIERLVDPGHPVRAIWALTGDLDLSAFYAPIRATVGEAGRSATDPRLLLALWLLANSQGVGSAREIERRCGHHPAYQWLTGLQIVNHHTLSDFRIGYARALEDLFVQVLAALSRAGLVKLERVMHDATRIRAQAGADSFRREGTLKERLRAARQQVRRLASQTLSQDWSRRERAAQARAARESRKRLELARRQLREARQGRRRRSCPEQTRVSLSEPEARVMKHGDGAYAPSYNLHLSTDSQAGIVVGLSVSQSACDADGLEPALDQIQRVNGRLPQQLVTDQGFTTADNVVRLARRGVELIGPVIKAAHQASDNYRKRGVSASFEAPNFQYQPDTDTYRCPGGRLVRFRRCQRTLGRAIKTYQAATSDCRSCPLQLQCCPKTQYGRVVMRTELAAEVDQFHRRMRSKTAQQVYKQRGAVAEFPHAWIKEKMGLRKFRLRGLIKVRIEALWACLTYDVLQYIRLTRVCQPAA